MYPLSWLHRSQHLITKPHARINRQNEFINQVISLDFNDCGALFSLPRAICSPITALEQCTLDERELIQRILNIRFYILNYTHFCLWFYVSESIFIWFNSIELPARCSHTRWIQRIVGTSLSQRLFYVLILRLIENWIGFFFSFHFVFDL